MGLRNLTTIQQALELIEKTKGVKVDLDGLPLDDKKTYELLAKGETMGVFQLESAGMKRVAKSLKPSQFSDVSALLALYRPGPMELIPQFIEGKHNPDGIQYLHPKLKQVFEETYGVMVYQEQVMQIFSLMAGYSLGEADMIRRAMGKKKISILDANKKRFVLESGKRGYNKKVAEKVWQYIMAFANYGFNKAHAASYAMISYQTAYLKANYPVEYMTALLSVEANSHSMNSEEKVGNGIEVAKKMGIEILPPDINKSRKDFVIEKNVDSLEGLGVRFGFGAVKNVGTAAVENILATQESHGEFASFTEFINKTDGRKVNKKVLESLAKVGAMDQFGTRASMIENLESIRQTAKQFESEIEGQDNLFGGVSSEVNSLQDSFVKLPEYPKQELLSFEKELFGFYLTEHPMAKSLQIVSKQANKKINDLDGSIHEGQIFTIGGILARVRQVVTKKSGKAMAFGTIQDDTGKMEFVIFPKTFAEYGSLLTENTVLLFKGKIDYRDEELQLLVEKVSSPKSMNLDEVVTGDHREIFVPRKTSKKTLQEVGKFLKENPGDESVVITIPNGGQPKKIKLPYGVKWSEKLETRVKKMLK